MRLLLRLKELTSFFLQLRQEFLLLMEGQLLQPRRISRVLPLRLERTVPLPEPEGGHSIPRRGFILTSAASEA